LTKDLFILKTLQILAKIFLIFLEKLHLLGIITKIHIKNILNDYRKWETASTCDPYILDALFWAITRRLPKASITIIENNIFDFVSISDVDVVAVCDSKYKETVVVNREIRLKQICQNRPGVELY